MSLRFLPLLCVLLALFLLPEAAQAASTPKTIYSDPTPVAVSVAAPPADAPVALEAERMGYDQKHKIVVAEGTVEVLQGDKIHMIVIGAVDGAVVSETVRGRFPGVDASGEIVTTASGLQYIELQPGTGAPPSGPGAVVEVHYTGYLVDGTKFDSSVDRGSPASFPLSNVIKGWTEGVGSMQVGSKRKLIIPFELAYGPGGRPPVIPAKATLIFDVELLKIVSDPAMSGEAGGAKMPPPVQPAQSAKPSGK